MKRLVIIAALLAAFGCKSDERTDKNKAEAETASGSATTPEAENANNELAPEVSTASKLWTFAPPDAVFGLVLADGGFATSVDAALEIKRIMAAVPEGQKLVADMEKELKAEAPFDIFDRAAYAKAGLSLDKGAAIFVDSDDEVVLILPVGDRDAFRKTAKIKTEKAGDRDVDRIDKGFCVAEKDIYICSDSLARVDKALAQQKGALLERVQGLPAELHGDVELVALFDKIPDSQKGLRDLGPAIQGSTTGVLSARMKQGKLTIRGWMDGKPPGPVASGLEALAFSPAVRNFGGDAVSVMSVRVPLEATGVMSQIPPSLPAAGFDFRTGVVDQLTGELAVYTSPAPSAMGMALTIAVGMKDTKALAEAMERLCPMGNAAPGVTIKAEKGKCTAEIDPDKLPTPEAKAFFPGKIPAILATKDNVLMIAVGGEPKAGNAASQSGSPAAKSMLEGKWNAVAWGRWADPLTGEGAMGKFLGSGLASAPKDAQAVAELFRVGVAHLYETGIAFKLDDQGAHLLAEVTTMAADPKEAYMAYSKAVTEGIASGKPYAAAIAEVTGKHPGSLAAKQGQLLAKSAPTLAFAIGMGAAIAIPAFLKYIERSKAAARPPEQIGR